VTLTNTGTIATMENNSIGIKGQSVGGGGGNRRRPVSTAPLSEDFELPENIDAANVANFLKTANKQSLITDGKGQVPPVLKTNGQGARRTVRSIFAKKSLKDSLGAKPEDIQLAILGRRRRWRGGEWQHRGRLFHNTGSNRHPRAAEAYGILAQSVGGGRRFGRRRHGRGARAISTSAAASAAMAAPAANGWRCQRAERRRSIETFGRLSYGIMAQSIGGGGGIAEDHQWLHQFPASGGTGGGQRPEGLRRPLAQASAAAPARPENGDAGHGHADRRHHGPGARSSTAIFAQSIGGGGGNGGAATAASYLKRPRSGARPAAAAATAAP